MTRNPTVHPHAPALAFILALGCALSGCSRDGNSAHPPITPAAAPEQNPRFTDTGEILSAEIAAAGATARYDAHFTNGQLTRIEEKRTNARGSAEGAYEFYGARLLRYTGASAQGEGALTLELDLQGRVVDARLDGRAATPDQVSAIRTRAQLLRSHALAQSATRAHAGQ